MEERNRYREEMAKEPRGYVLAPNAVNLGIEQSFPGGNIFIQGIVTYTDVFKTAHKTWFCYHQVSLGKLYMCPQGNGME